MTTAEINDFFAWRKDDTHAFDRGEISRDELERRRAAGVAKLDALGLKIKSGKFSVSIVLK